MTWLTVAVLVFCALAVLFGRHHEADPYAGEPWDDDDSETRGGDSAA